MVPVEPISLSIGIAALFTTCVDCFEYFKAAKGFRQNFEVLLVKLEYQQERLLVWGDLVGIGTEGRHGLGPILENNENMQDLTKRCLVSIGSLLKDTEILKSKYGLKMYIPANDTIPQSGISLNALKRFRLRQGRQPQGPGILDKTRWAIHDETKFQKLVDDIRDLIDGLSETVPVSSALEEQKVQDDIASMVDDIQSLHLFQEACKDDYPRWSAVASAAIDASEVATLDNRLADERLEHYGSSTQGGSGVGIDFPAEPTRFGDQKVSLDANMEIYFILTESCRAQGSETPCDQLRLGEMSFKRQNSFITPGSVRTRSAPGYRITRHIDPSRFTYADLERYTENLDAMKFLAITNGDPWPIEDGRYRVRVYIYCAPCACQVATALDICKYSDKKDFVEFCIRIDHQQMTSCSASVSRIEGLISVIDHLKETETYDTLHVDTHNRLESIDREWLERNIYDYTEEDRLSTLSPKNQLARIVEFHEKEASCAAVILLGEADYTVPLMGVPPFRLFEPGRMPRETQLFRYSKQYNYETQATTYERQYMGTYSPRAPLPPRQPPPPAGLAKTQAKESPERGTKRARSSTSDEEDS